MAYAFGMHEFECKYKLGCYVLNNLWLQRPIIVYVVVETAIINVVHQKVEMVLILKTAYNLHKIRTFIKCLQNIPLTKHLRRLIKLQNLLFA